MTTTATAPTPASSIAPSDWIEPGDRSGTNPSVLTRLTPHVIRIERLRRLAVEDLDMPGISEQSRSAALHLLGQLYEREPDAADVLDGAFITAIYDGELQLEISVGAATIEAEVMPGGFRILKHRGGTFETQLAGTVDQAVDAFRKFIASDGRALHG